ncbi:baseplate wedge initiator [Pelagibacter phage HTVC008M]|jgi:formylmethanofuran dehydrogenase subunit C|uniref:baseplate wedge initiator n=1 Tax=Pelagibacter phage HTVC008M TaxID=1283076 RepID=UPI0002B27955|nr:baseplate wedge initiator [Pelagibacter phage HTVC008M]AGE60393.1 hypothetical protein [Pelagibacter phage HTVC008M]
MAARQVAADATIEQLRTTFNTLSATDFGDISALNSSISASNLVAAMNELEGEVTPFSAAFIATQTDLGAAPATGDSIVIRDADASALKEMTIANLFTSPAIDTITAGTFTLDASADVNIDAGGGDIILKDDGTEFGRLTNNAGQLLIKSSSSATTALSLNGANVTVAGNLTVSGTTTTVDSSTVNLQTGFIFEGSSADSFETTLTATDPTADRTITLPDLTGTVSLTSATETLTNKTLTSPVLTTPIFTGATDQRGSFVFEGSTADSFETTVSVVDPTADRTINFPNVSGTVLTTGNFSDITAIGVQSGSIVFEGSTANSFETTLAVTDATADRTITLPDLTGTVSLTTATETLTNKTLTTPVIVEATSGSTITLNATTDIVLDADGGDVFFKDDGTTFGSATNTSGNLIIKSGTTTALTFSGANVAAAGTLSATTITASTGLETKNGATGAGFVKFFEDSDNGTNAVTLLGPASTGDIDITLPTQAGTVVVSNTTDGNDVQLDSLGLNTAASGTAGELRATNDITAFYSSDVSLKENIVEIPSALDMVDKIRGVFFDWKDDYIESKGGEDGYFMRKHDVGLIAQEVEAVLPEIVGTRKDGIKAIKYDRLTALLLQAIKELQAKIK